MHHVFPWKITYFFRKIFRFGSWKKCTKSDQSWEQYIKSLVVFFIWKYINFPRSFFLSTKIFLYFLFAFIGCKVRCHEEILIHSATAYRISLGACFTTWQNSIYENDFYRCEDYEINFYKKERKIWGVCIAGTLTVAIALKGSKMSTSFHFFFVDFILKEKENEFNWGQNALPFLNL
jgi:hypothetical protein